MKILVTGASGQFGQAAIKHLRAHTNPSQISALVRSASKGESLQSAGVQVLVGDYDDLDTLRNAFSQVDKVLFVSGSDIAAREQQHKNIVSAAKEVGVKHIIYTGVVGSDIAGVSPIEMVENAHRLTELWLQESGLNYTVLGNSLYADVIPMFIGDQVVPNKTLFFPAGEGKTSFATRDNMAEAAAKIALEPSTTYYNRHIDITGAEAVGFAELAKAIGNAVREEISYVSPEIKSYEEILKGAQLPAEIVGMLSGFAQAIEQGYFEKVTVDLENILGRKPDQVTDFLKTVYGK